MGESSGGITNALPRIWCTSVYVAVDVAAERKKKKKQKQNKKRKTTKTEKSHCHPSVTILRFLRFCSRTSDHALHVLYSIRVISCRRTESFRCFDAVLVCLWLTDFVV